MKVRPSVIVWIVIIIGLVIFVYGLARGVGSSLPQPSYRVAFVAAKDGSSVRVVACPKDKPCDGKGSGQVYCVPAGRAELRIYMKDSVHNGDIVSLQEDKGASCAAAEPAGAGNASSSSGGSGNSSGPAGAPKAQDASEAPKPPGAAAPHGSEPPHASKPDDKSANKPDTNRSGTTPAPAKPATATALQKLEIQAAEVDPSERGWTLAGAAVLLLLLTWGILRLGPRSLILGADNRYSKSKFQMVVWFGVLMVAYLSVLWLRFYHSASTLVGGVNIPPHLLEISGLSALTFAGAKAITQTKENTIAAAAAQNPALASQLKTSAPSPSFLDDLTRDDLGQVDLGDFQMVLLTLIAAFTYLVLIFTDFSRLALQSTVTLPDVDTTILGALGLGQGAYLAKKYVSGPNPPTQPPAAPAAPAAPVVPAAPAAAAIPAVPPTQKIGKEA